MPPRKKSKKNTSKTGDDTYSQESTGLSATQLVMVRGKIRSKNVIMIGTSAAKVRVVVFFRRSLRLI